MLFTPTTQIPKNPTNIATKLWILQYPFEKLGDAVEAVEKEHGREGMIAAKLVRGIRLVSKDLGKQPSIEYEREDWKRCMKLLSDSSRDTGDDSYRRQRLLHLREHHILLMMMVSTKKLICQYFYVYTLKLLPP
ncbi:hypothetical protein J3R30DRAFT_3400318 [Lentinula aciculospora]|uniref:Uncharacterized protein n=1 Tax=Lentinula aciculospora TaxID=153920 RepID=A0A9W9APH8_9AGAR|nr:hypothetical protein J3R30DRAFT_3400318 [Lentinula aciculospora]